MLDIEGGIPSEWSWERLLDISRGTGEYGSGSAAQDYREGTSRYVRITDITEDGRLEPEGLKSLPKEEAQKYRLGQGDLLFARSGSVGLTYLYDPADGSCAFAGYLIRFKLDDTKCDPSFVAHWTQTPFYWSWVRRTAHQLAQANINATEYGQLPVPAPKLPEQCRIAHVLDTADAAIRRTEAVIDKLEQVRQGLLHDLLTRGVDEDGRLRPSPEEAPEEYQEERWGKIPKNWEAACLSDCLSIQPQNGIYKPSSEIGAGDLLVGQTALTGDRRVDFSAARRVRLTPDERAKFGLVLGDILLARVFATVKGVGQPAIVSEPPEPAVYESNMMRIRPDKDVIEPALVFHWLRASNTRRWVESRAKKSNQASLSKGTVQDIPIGIPTKGEQHRLVSISDTSRECINSRRAHLAKMKALKAGLMQDLLSGRVRVPKSIEVPA